VWAQRACGEGRVEPKPVEPPCEEAPGAGGRSSGAGRGEEALLELLGGGAGGGTSASGGVGAGGGSRASHS
jgi:hypothetical protein